SRRSACSRPSSRATSAPAPRCARAASPTRSGWSNSIPNRPARRWPTVGGGIARLRISSLLLSHIPIFRVVPMDAELHQLLQSDSPASRTTLYLRLLYSRRCAQLVRGLGTGACHARTLAFVRTIDFDRLGL